MKIYKVVILFTTLLLNSYLLTAQINPIEDWVAPYKDTSIIKDINDADKRTLYKIVHDFNGDGVLDLALCDPYIGGAHDIPWQIFLQGSDHTYVDVGEIWCEDFVSVRRIAPKTSKLIAFEHWNSEEGFLNEYKVSFKGIKHLRRYSTKSLPSTYMDSLWARCDFVDSSCAIRDLILNINFKWKKRGE